MNHLEGSASASALSVRSTPLNKSIVPSDFFNNQKNESDDSLSEATDDATLLAHIAEGSQIAFWIIWLRYKNDLFWTCHRLYKGNRHDIHDAMSSLSLRLLKDMPGHARSIVSCRIWIRRVAINHFIDLHRTRQRCAMLVGSFDDIAQLTDQQINQNTPDPENDNATRLLLGKVLDLLDRIEEPRIRKAAHMRFIEEKPYKDIAEILQVSQELVRKWIQQVRIVLRHALRAPGDQ